MIFPCIVLLFYDIILKRIEKSQLLENITERLVRIMCKKQELIFSIFILYSLADKWKMSPAKVYKILNSTGILDNYIIKCYDVLHTQGKEYLVEDITDFVREKGVNV